ncbi:MAG: class I SAM-dependent methyltransferase [Planctomycetia bacterium]|nr:class I SAM-dependent methyltransferase [Planctomycetia bacterium]
MASPATLTHIRTWSTLPTQWSRGLQRRARSIWRKGLEYDAREFEQLAARFARQCLAVGVLADPLRQHRWLVTLRTLGFHAEAVTLAARWQASVTSLSAEQLAELDVLHVRIQRVLQRVASLFEHDEQSLPRRIATNDSRLKAVLHWTRSLPNTARIADLGCGSGRFLQALHEVCATWRLIGVDLARTMMTEPPAGVAMAAGGMLCLPFADESLDAVLSVEALEHALRPRVAVNEMLRVLRPGGHLLIIDKHRSWQARCEHEPWECWFELPEVAGWLTPQARIERCELLPADGGEVPDGLFCLWTAVKHG